MQSQKSRGGSSSSPGAFPATPRSSRTAKSSTSDSDCATPPHSGGRLSVERSPKSSPNKSNPKPKLSDHKSPKSPLSEKHASKVSELQQQIAQAQEELKKTKEQLAEAETVKSQTSKDLQESKKLAEETAAKLEDSEKRTAELTEKGQAQILDLKQAYDEASKERDRAWQAQLEAVERQHAMDVAALLSTSQELQRVKHELSLSMDARTITIAQVDQASMEIESLKLEIANLKMPEPNLLEAHEHLENLRSELKESKAAEARALMAARDANLNLQETRMEFESVKAEENKALESLRQVSAELAESNAGFEKAKFEVSALAETVSGLKAELEKTRSELVDAKKRDEEMLSKEAEGEENTKKSIENLELDLLQATAEAGQAKIELETAYEEAQKAKLEAEQLKAMLEAAETKFEAMLGEARADAERAEGVAMKTRLEGDEFAVQTNERECKLMEALRDAGAKANATKEESEKIMLEVADLKASLMDKETELQNILEENETLKINEAATLEKNAQLEKVLAMVKKSESSITNENALNEKPHVADALLQEKIAEALEKVASANARAEDALEKLRVCEMELENSSQRANRSVEQLEAAQAANLTMEADMKKLRIQTDQWKKAADAAATVLAAAHNGELNSKVVERSASLLSDSDVLNMRFSSPMKDDFDTSPTSKKKKAMLKKLGDLWKKRSQK